MNILMLERFVRCVPVLFRPESVTALLALELLSDLLFNSENNINIDDLSIISDNRTPN